MELFKEELGVSHPILEGQFRLLEVNQMMFSHTRKCLKWGNIVFIMDPSMQNSLIKEAENRGYLKIEKNRIIYFCNRRYEDDYLDPEERVRAAIYSWLILEKEYSPECIRVESSVPARVPAERADIVLYESEDCRVPYLVIECKARGTSESDRTQAIEQLFGYANSLRTTKYGLYEDLDTSILYDIQNFPPLERQENILGPRDNLPKNYGKAKLFQLVAGSPISDIRSVSTRELENVIRRAHAEIWSGGRRDPLLSFDEWCKLLFIKIYDERNTPNDNPRGFQVGTGESSVSVGNRIRRLYGLARIEDPSIFTAPIRLPDNKIYQVVKLIQHIGFTLIDVDSLGTAFETFFSEVFRGSLGQYFTRRELVRFICAIISPDERDIILDPTAGSGGFLLEALMHVWRKIEERYAGQPGIERRKYDFARNHLFGIEIHDILGRVCQTNLMLHKDGHTNIEVSRSCLDSSFNNPRINLDSTIFTIIMGNPPFGDTIREGDTDRLGTSRLSDFELAVTSQISSEIVIIERSLKFLRSGGKVGMVVPDGLLNNSGENSRCPGFRRYLFRNAQILAVVSLPDYAFRKAGAQNKTSIIFCKKFEPHEKQLFDIIYRKAYEDEENRNLKDIDIEKKAISIFLEKMPYNVFLAEAEYIGYTPSGNISERNELYSHTDRVPNPDDQDTILGQYNLFLHDPEAYQNHRNPDCIKINAFDLFNAHLSNRIDPKYHIFKTQRLIDIPPRMIRYKLERLLTPKRDIVIPHDFPDELFMTLTLSQDGTLSSREAGKGNNPPDWHGAYFGEEAKWFKVHSGDLIYSRIDLWKGCVSVIPEEYNGSVVTNEFPVFEVDTDIIRPHYLKLLLRSEYFQRAIRAITTGHSNRRRTQLEDFLNLEVFLPDLTIQDAIVDIIREQEDRISFFHDEYGKILLKFDKTIIGSILLDEFLKSIRTNKQ